MTFQERHYSAQDGRRLYYRDYGDPLSAPPPLLCLPGLTRNSKDFDLLARRLCGQRRVVCPDYRGRGRSDYDPDWRTYAPREILSDVRHLTIAAGLHRVIVCGASFGGLLAMALSVAAPTILAGVILNDVGPDLSPKGTARILDYIGRDHPQPDWETAVSTMRQTFPYLSYKTEEDWRSFTEASFREGADGLLHVDYDTDLVRPLRETREEEDIWPLFAALSRVPVLVIRGGVSDVLSAETLEKMQAVKPELTQVTLAGVGHMPSLNEPESEQAIDDFLKRIGG